MSVSPDVFQQHSVNNDNEETRYAAGIIFDVITTRLFPILENGFIL